MATKGNVQSLAGMFHTTGERVYALRKEKGCTQGDLAELLETTKATISRYESNLIDIPKNKLQKLAEFFGVTPAFLMCWTDNINASVEVFEGTSKPPRVTTYADLNPFAEPTQSREDRLETELLRIFRSLSVRGQTRLLSSAYEIQEHDDRPPYTGFRRGKAPRMTTEDLNQLVAELDNKFGKRTEPPKREEQPEEEIDYQQELADFVDSIIKEREKK